MDQRLGDFLNQFNPPPGKHLWYGGASLFGTLRGLPAEQAAWRAEGHDHVGEMQVLKRLCRL